MAWNVTCSFISVKNVKISHGKSHVMTFTIFLSLTIFSPWLEGDPRYPTSRFPVITFVPVTTFLLVIFVKKDFLNWRYVSTWVHSKAYCFTKTMLKLNKCLCRYDILVFTKVPRCQLVAVRISKVEYLTSYLVGCLGMASNCSLAGVFFLEGKLGKLSELSEF